MAYNIVAEEKLCNMKTKNASFGVKQTSLGELGK